FGPRPSRHRDESRSGEACIVLKDNIVTRKDNGAGRRLGQKIRPSGHVGLPRGILRLSWRLLMTTARAMVIGAAISVLIAGGAMAENAAGGIFVSEGASAARSTGTIVTPKQARKAHASVRKCAAGLRLVGGRCIK